MQSNKLLKKQEVVSVAVKIGKDSTLYKLDQGLPLQIIIKQLCEERNIEYIPNYYALQVTDAKEGNVNKYITEDNRTSFITNGSELRLIFSATEMCKMIQEKITCEDELEWTLEKLCTLSKDKTFAEEFVSMCGLSFLVSFIQKAIPPYEMIDYCVKTLLSFYNFNLILNIESIPFDSLIHFVSNFRMFPLSIVEYSLLFLKNILNSKRVPVNLAKMIKNKIDIEDVIKLLHLKENSHLQENALAYLNVVLLKSEMSYHNIISQLETKRVREIIWKNIIMNSVVTPSIAQELYIFQYIFMKDLALRLKTCIEPNSDEEKYLQELNNISYSPENHIKRDSIISYFEEHSLDKPTNSEPQSRTSSCDYDNGSEKWKHLLQQSTSIPESDYEESNELEYNHSHSQSQDISLLTLDCMQYFSRRRLKTFTKIKLMEEKVQKKPFDCICDRLVHLLVDTLQLDQKLSFGSTCYQPLVFEATRESPFFEELFCRVVVRLSSTSKEMKARTSQDHDKVMKVLHHQVTSVLNKQIQSWKKFEEELENMTYEKVVESWQSRNDQNLMKLQDLPAVSEFRESLKKDIEELIVRKRLNFLCGGSKFIKVNSRTQKPKKKYWFIYLSPNHTVFHYGDCNDSTSDEKLSVSKMAVSNIKELLVGKKCPHVREAKQNRKIEPEYAFSLILDNGEQSSLDFIAPSQEIYDYWTDGLCYLLGTKMKSKSMESELKILLDMEVRLHLLELEGIDIPEVAPLIPNDSPIIVPEE